MATALLRYRCVVDFCIELDKPEPSFETLRAFEEKFIQYRLHIHPTACQRIAALYLRWVISQLVSDRHHPVEDAHLEAFGDAISPFPDPPQQKDAAVVSDELDEFVEHMKVLTSPKLRYLSQDQGVRFEMFANIVINDVIKHFIGYGMSKRQEFAAVVTYLLKMVTHNLPTVADVPESIEELMDVWDALLGYTDIKNLSPSTDLMVRLGNDYQKRERGMFVDVGLMLQGHSEYQRVVNLTIQNAVTYKALFPTLKKTTLNTIKPAAITDNFCEEIDAMVQLKLQLPPGKTFDLETAMRNNIDSSYNKCKTLVAQAKDGLVKDLVPLQNLSNAAVKAATVWPSEANKFGDIKKWCSVYISRSTKTSEIGNVLKWIADIPPELNEEHRTQLNWKEFDAFVSKAKGHDFTEEMQNNIAAFVRAILHSIADAQGVSFFPEVFKRVMNSVVGLLPQAHLDVVEEWECAKAGNDFLIAVHEYEELGHDDAKRAELDHDYQKASEMVRKMAVLASTKRVRLPPDVDVPATPPASTYPIRDGAFKDRVIAAAEKYRNIN